MGRKSKQKNINREIKRVVEEYNLVRHAVLESGDKSYAIVLGIQSDGVPRVSVIAPGGMSAEKMQAIAEISKENFREVLEQMRATNADI